MKRISYLFVLLCGILLVSCSGKKLPIHHFAQLSKPIAFNGIYLNENDKLARLLNIERDKTDFITIEYSLENRDTLNILYHTENGLEHKKLKGKFKDNFFEVYFSNRRVYIPIIYTIHNVNRVRLGADKDGNLLLYK